MLLQKPVLVLNNAYEPIHVCSAKRAVVLVFKGFASVEEESGHILHTRLVDVKVPSVIKLHTYRRVPRQSRALCRKNILIRDRYVCQYCRRPFSPKELTLDHVLPRSRKGQSSWENLVACCFPCNNKKGSGTPEEVGMKLLNKPTAYGVHTSRHLLRLMGSEHETWQKYLYY